MPPPSWRFIIPRARTRGGARAADQQPVAVLGEGGGIPRRVLDAEPDKPAKQQVVVDPLDQLPLGADRIERLQQQGAHQPLGRDRLPTNRRIQLGELGGRNAMLTREIISGFNILSLAGFVVMALTLALSRSGQTSKALSIGLMCAGTALVFFGLYAGGGSR
jgi:hypothetical protein